MWKIFFNYKDKSRCTVKGKGTITPELAVKSFYRYGLHAAESIYQQYPKKDHEPVPLEEKMREFGVDATEMKTVVLHKKNFFEEHKNTVIFLMKTVKKYANYTQKTDIF